MTTIPALVARLTVDEHNDAIARIIDPLPFKSWDLLYRYCLDTGDTEEWARGAADGFHLAAMNEARDKAKAIRAYLEQEGKA